MEFRLVSKNIKLKDIDEFLTIIKKAKQTIK